MYELVDLTPLQRDVLKIYTKGGDTAINRYLRGLYKNKRHARTKWNDVKKEVNHNISFNEALKVMEDIFEKGISLKQDIMVVRRERKRNMKPKNGIFKAKGIISTSIDDCVKKKFYGENVNYIKLEKGTKILYLEQLSQFNDDYEIILPHESEFQYIGEKGNMGKIWKYNNI